MTDSITMQDYKNAVDIIMELLDFDFGSNSVEINFKKHWLDSWKMNLLIKIFGGVNNDK